MTIENDERLKDLRKRSKELEEQHKNRLNGLLIMVSAKGKGLLSVEGKEYDFYKKFLNKKKYEMYPSTVGRANVIEFAKKNPTGHGIVDLDYFWLKNKQLQDEKSINNLFILNENNHEMKILNSKQLKKIFCEINNINISSEQLKFTIECCKLIGNIRGKSIQKNKKAMFQMNGESIGCLAFKETSGDLNLKGFEKLLIREFYKWNTDWKNELDLEKKLPPHKEYQIVNGKDLIHLITL